MPTIRLFASHDWGIGASNHALVAQVVAELRRRNLSVWFDETHMRGNILDSMCRGIDSSDVVLVFLTANYMKKVESRNGSDNVRREFMYAANTPDKFLCIKFDETLPSPWTGPVSMLLGSQLYVDLTEINSTRIDSLVDAIRHRSPRLLWKTAVQRTRILHDVPRSPCRPPKTVLKAPPLRDRVRIICEHTGGTYNDDLHLCKLVDRLHVSLVGTVDSETPLHARIALMEKHIGI
tara:strand:- start:32153 stop:32857 length:705 start_codon:yes stop_codon:yes gene_type:complete